MSKASTQHTAEALPHWTPVSRLKVDFPRNTVEVVLMAGLLQFVLDEVGEAGMSWPLSHRQARGPCEFLLALREKSLYYEIPSSLFLALIPCPLETLWLHSVFFTNCFTSAKPITKQQAISGNKVNGKHLHI